MRIDLSVESHRWNREDFSKRDFKIRISRKCSVLSSFSPAESTGLDEFTSLPLAPSGGGR